MSGKSSQISLEQEVLDRLRALTVDQQREVLAYIDTLPLQPAPPHVRPLRGLWAGTDISAQDIDDVRHEIWASFPRDLE